MELLGNVNIVVELAEDGLGASVTKNSTPVIVNRGINFAGKCAKSNWANALIFRLPVLMPGIFLRQLQEEKL